MIDLRKRIFLIVSIIVGLILAVLLIYIVTNKETEPASEGDVSGEDTSAGSEETSGATPGKVIVKKGTVIEGDVSKTTVENPEKLYLTQQARLFVERYGTYSNEDQNKHIEDVLPLATPTMVTWLKTQTIPFSSTYHSVSTDVVTAAVTALTGASATVSIGVNQVTETDAGKTDAQKNGRVEFEKVNNEWKVDGLYWRN